MRKQILASMLTLVSLLANVEPWKSWPQLSKLFETQMDYLSNTAKSDGLVSDEESMDEEGFSYL